MGGFCEEPDHVHFGRMWRTLKLWTRKQNTVSRDEQAVLIGAYDSSTESNAEGEGAAQEAPQRNNTLLAPEIEGIPMLFGQRV